MTLPKHLTPISPTQRVSIETIGGKLCTVIRRPFDTEWVREQLAMGVPVIAERISLQRFLLVRDDHEGKYKGIKADSPYGYYSEGRTIDIAPHIFEYTITILPALPRNPKPEHAALLYRYASESLNVRYEIMDADLRCADGLGIGDILNHLGCCPIEITHCLDTQGNRVEVAIEEV